MSITSFVSKIFGNKAQRDMSEVQPIVEKIKAKYDEFGSLTADDLRTKIHEIRQMLQDNVAQDKEEIKNLRATIEETEIDKREKIYSQIDALEKKILDKYEHKLDEVLPEVFAIMKHTARFFKENETIEVKATDFDRSLSIACSGMYACDRKENKYFCISRLWYCLMIYYGRKVRVLFSIEYTSVGAAYNVYEATLAPVV